MGACNLLVLQNERRKTNKGFMHLSSRNTTLDSCRTIGVISETDCTIALQRIQTINISYSFGAQLNLYFNIQTQNRLTFLLDQKKEYTAMDGQLIQII
jgi:hypothetical protein